jgi:hypothetical protein
VVALAAADVRKGSIKAVACLSTCLSILVEHAGAVVQWPASLGCHVVCRGGRGRQCCWCLPLLPVSILLSPLPLLQVMAKLTDKAQSAVRRAIVGMLLAASRAYVRARRVVGGVSLEYARTPRPAWAYIAAALTCAALAPLQSVASKLVFSKVG